MDFLKNRLHRLIDQLSEEELKSLGTVLTDIYYDFSVLQAIRVGQRSRNPGDALTHDEALRFLSLI